jgi:tetratricopeptide (TPR) repeat protein
MSTVWSTELELVGADGRGGDSEPPSARTGAASRHASVNTASNLFIDASPFFKLNEQQSITLNTSDPQSLFVRFWELRCQNKALDALAVCDALLEVIEPDDYESHLRQWNARAMVARDLSRFRSAYFTHLSARPLLSKVTSGKIKGDHHHGLAKTLMELGQFLSAYQKFERSRECYAEMPEQLALTDNNTALLMIRMGKPELSYVFAENAHTAWERLGLSYRCAEADDIRAQAYLAEERFALALEFANRAIETLSFCEGQSLALTGARETRDRVERAIDGGVR